VTDDPTPHTAPTTDPTSNVAMTFTFTRPTYSDEEVRTFFAPMLTERDGPEQPRCPCGCGAVEHWVHGRRL
jgi:hypothetical protein